MGQEVLAYIRHGIGDAGKEVCCCMDSCDGNSQHNRGGYTKDSVLFVRGSAQGIWRL